MIANSGMSGIQTCDVVVDGNNNAVDCSLWSNFFHAACWNPLAPCAATGSTNGEPASIDNSLSQLGPVGGAVLEGNSSFLGIGLTTWVLGGLGFMMVMTLLGDLGPARYGR